MVNTRTGGGRDDGPFFGMSKEDIGRHKLSLSDQQWLGEQIRANARTVQELHGWLGIPERSLQRFANKVNEATAFRPRGRPAMLDGAALADLEDFVTLRRRGEKVKSEAAFAAKVRVLAGQTRIRGGNHRPVPRPSKKYLKKVKKCLKRDVRTTACSQQSGLVGDGATDILAAQLALGTGQISAEQMQQMRSAWLPCVDLFNQHGQLTEAMLDAAGVPQPVFPAYLVDSRQTPHEERPMENQRSTNLTHDASKDRATHKFQLKLCRKGRLEQKKKAQQEKKEWTQQLKDPNSDFSLALRKQLLEIQEETMDEALERDAQFALQSEWLVQQRQTEALADWEAPKSTAPRPVKPKRPAAARRIGRTSALIPMPVTR